MKLFKYILFFLAVSFVFASVSKEDIDVSGLKGKFDGISFFDDNPEQAMAGRASYYADKYHGRRTSSGEIFNKNAMTAAHKTLEFGTRLKVTNLDNGKSVIVKINDRGPFKPGRILDVSEAAARKLDMIKNGTARVSLEVIPEK